MPIAGAEPQHRRGLALSLALATVIVISLARALPPDAFFSGDSGVKLVAARNALAHPTRPFEVEAPIVRGTPMPDLMDGFYARHGDHAHAITSPVFPVLAAPFLGMFGLRGLAVLPVAGLLAALLGLALTAARLDTGTGGAPALWVALITTPLLFYGLEFWEHTLAAGAAYLATTLFIESTDHSRRPVVAGLLMGAAMVLRPEAACYAIALVIADRTLSQPARLRDILMFIAGSLVVLAPILAYNVFHLGTAAGAHMGVNEVPLGAEWWHWRWNYTQTWLGPMQPVVVVLLAAAIAAGAGAIVLRTRHLALRTAVLASACILAVLAARRALPFDSLWAVCPAALLLLSPLTSQSGDRFARVLAGVTVLLVIAAAPNDGGAQWGPRYLLLATGPAAIAIWFALRDVWRRRMVAPIALGILLVIASTAVQRQAFKELKAIKQGYGRLQATIREIAQGDVVLSDTWWLDQVAGAHGPPPVFLFAARQAWPDAVSRLERAGVVAFSIVADPTDAETAAGVDGSVHGTSFHVGAHHDIDGAGLTIYGIESTRLAR